MQRVDMAERLTMGGGAVLLASLALTDSRLKAVYRDGLCVELAADDPRWVKDYAAMDDEGVVVVGGGAGVEEVAAELWKVLCSECPVWRECLDYAVDTRQHGIWSGTTETRRRLIRASKQAMQVQAE